MALFRASISRIARRRGAEESAHRVRVQGLDSRLLPRFTPALSSFSALALLRAQCPKEDDYRTSADGNYEITRWRDSRTPFNCRPTGSTRVKIVASHRVTGVDGIA